MLLVVSKPTHGKVHRKPTKIRFGYSRREYMVVAMQKIINFPNLPSPDS
jgi:hypothetical protein